MAKQLDIRIDRRSFTVYPTKLERKKVYGWNELRVVTQNGTNTLPGIPRRESER